MVSEFDTIRRAQGGPGRSRPPSPRSPSRLVSARRLDLLLDSIETLPESAVDHQVEHRVGEDAKPKAKKEAREAVEKEIRNELLEAPPFDVQVS